MTYQQFGRRYTLLKKIELTLFNQSIASSQLNSWDIDLGPYSWKILVLRVAPSNTILRIFLEMCGWFLLNERKDPSKEKVIQNAS